MAAGGPQPSEVRLRVTKPPVVVSGHALGSTEHRETASQLNGLIIIDKLIMMGGGGERGTPLPGEVQEV